MKIQFTLLLIVFVIFKTFGQKQNWSVKTSVKPINTFGLLKGKIGGKYAITMGLYPSSGLCGDEGRSNKFRNQVKKGWYYYDKYKIKIPLLGTVGYSDAIRHIHLKVPSNYFDTLDLSNCQVTDYQEEFINQGNSSPTRMKWKKKGDTLYQDVKLDIIDTMNLKTEAFIEIYLNGILLREIDIGKKLGAYYLWDINEYYVKKIGKYMHITFKTSEPSMPGAMGGGQCGAGDEDYIGYIKLNEKLEILRFDTKKIGSCIDYFSAEKYHIVKDKPELGLVEGIEPR